MANDVVAFSVPEIRQIGESIAKSGLFGIKTVDQAVTLCLIAQAEGRHPALAARDYHVIQGAPAKKAEAMARDFLSAGGRIEWHQLDDEAADATFSHPAGGSIRITWDQARVAKAGLGSNPMHKRYPRQMLRSRVVSEGVRTVWPMATSGMYVPEEVAEFTPQRSEPIDITPKADLDSFAASQAPPALDEDRLRLDAEEAAGDGVEGFRDFWRRADAEQRAALKPDIAEYQRVALDADARRAMAGDDDPFGLPPLGAAADAAGSPPAPSAPAPSDGPPGPEQAHSAPRGGTTASPAGDTSLVIDPAPGKAGKPDWRAWSMAQFGPKLQQKLTAPDLADFLGANEKHLTEAKRQLDAADCRDLIAAISAQWDRVGAAEKAGT